ncbi:MAG: prepilin peptidase [Candidatus Polarisedimenticolia bacterium]
MPAALIWFLVVGVGLCVGSFLNVCIHRLPAGRSIVAPRSACPGCGAPIAWHDNVPLLSYGLLLGRCRRCRAPIGWRYPAVEGATGLLFALLFLDRGPSVAFLDGALLGALLVALIVIDALHQILPDRLTLPGVAAGLLLSPLRAAPHPVRDALIGATLGYLLPFAINAAYRGLQAARRVPAAAREDGIGMGDFKLLAMIGAFLGPRLLLFTVFVGSVAGATAGIWLILRRGYGWKSRLPFGVFLGGAALLALFAGDAWIAWYLGRAGFAP